MRDLDAPLAVLVDYVERSTHWRAALAKPPYVMAWAPSAADLAGLRDAYNWLKIEVLAAELVKKPAAAARSAPPEEVPAAVAPAVPDPEAPQKPVLHLPSTNA